MKGDDRITISKTFIDKACAVVPNFENSISLFHKKLRLAQYAEHCIYDYKLKIAQAALYLQKLPDDFTQDDIRRRYPSDDFVFKTHGVSTQFRAYPHFKALFQCL